MRVLLFNPENDLALAAEASGVKEYTPPKGALEVGWCGALLPLWWASAEDVVLLPRNLDERRIGEYMEEARRMRDAYGLCGRVETPERLRETGEVRYATPVPWGWSRYARRLFREAGVAEECLPADSRLDDIKELSHRRHTVRVNREVADRLRAFGGDFSDRYSLPPLPVEAKSVAEVEAALLEWGTVMVKLPWSCSSRGVIKVMPDNINSLRERIAGMIRRQRSVMAEKYLKMSDNMAVRDFAALFESDGGGKVRFRAWSLFRTDSNGRYAGNLVASQEELLHRLPLPEEVAVRVAEALQESLGNLVGYSYKGWLGVDMMVWSGEEGRLGIAPCVEINLRSTMGVAAMHVSSRTVCGVARILNVTSGGCVLTPDILP